VRTSVYVATYGRGLWKLTIDWNSLAPTPAPGPSPKVTVPDVIRFTAIQAGDRIRAAGLAPILRGPQGPTARVTSEVSRQRHPGQSRDQGHGVPGGDRLVNARRLLSEHSKVYCPLRNNFRLARFGTFAAPGRQVSNSPAPEALSTTCSITR